MLRVSASYFVVCSVDLEAVGGQQVHISMLPNPSHLEAVNPVALGKVRGRQLTCREGPYSLSAQPATTEQPSRVLSVQVHGDAAFSAQGVVAESLGLASLPHFDVGGTLHLIVNNQLGFTTEEDHGRSSQHCSDVVKAIGAPVIHVNGGNPEASCHHNDCMPDCMSVGSGKSSRNSDGLQK